MQAYCMTSPGVIASNIVPDPRPGPRELLLQTEAVSLCSTDISYFRGHLHPDDWPIIPGHEYVGRVVEIGCELEGPVREDDRVVYWGQTDFGGLAGLRCIRPMFPFGTSEDVPFYTLRGFCDSTGAAACVVPDSLESAAATIAEPLTSVLRSLLQWAPRPGDTVAILGAGPSALLALQVLRRCLAAGRIIVLDRDVKRLALAMELGADTVADPVDDVDAIHKLVHDARGEVADFVFDALPHIAAEGPGHRTRSLGMDLLRPGGAYSVYGATAELQGIDLWRILAKGLHVRAAGFDVRAFPMERSSHVLSQAVRLLDSGIVDGKPLVTNEVMWEDLVGITDAFARYGRNGALKSSINWVDTARPGAGRTPVAA